MTTLSTITSVDLLGEPGPMTTMFTQDEIDFAVDGSAPASRPPLTVVETSRRREVVPDPAPLVTLVTDSRPAKPADLAAYLDAVHAFLCRYVAFPSEHEPVAIACWMAHARVVERFECSPILAVTSAEMRSGKTRVLDCAELLAEYPVRMVMPSEAVLYSVLAQRPRPTLLLDEVDAIFGPRPSERTEGIRAVLNSGNRAGTPVLRVRLEGKRREVEAFDVFGAKAVAGIGELPATLADRSIVIRMRRRAPDESVARFRTRTARAEAIAIRQPDWSSVPLVPAIPDVPDGINDRAADGWEPLLTMADLAGGDWPARARAAALALSSDDDAPASVGIRLLSDIRDAFGPDEHLPTGDLLNRLHEVDGSPWGDWYGSPLSPRELAKLLAPYRIGPAQRRVRGEKSRGYFTQDFQDAWNRYVAAVPLPTPGHGTSGTTGTPLTPAHQHHHRQSDGLVPAPWDPEYATDDDAEVPA